MDTSKPSGFHIPSLDGIRACSILLVFLAHAGLDSSVPGGYGVTVFFFLSGYLITTLLSRERDRTGTISVRNFYIRRTLRIFPPMYLALGAALLVGAFGVLPGNRFDGTSVFSLATFWANYYTAPPGWNMPTGTTAFWSLAIEEHYYLLFPVTFLLLRRYVSSRATAFVLLALSIGALAWRCVLVFQFGHDHDRIYYGTDTRFDNILYGSVLALLWNPALGASWKRPRWQLLALAAGCAALVLFTFLCRNEEFRNTLRYTIQGVTLIPLFFYVIYYKDTLAHKFLNLPPVVFLGKISYSFYLLHILIIALVYEHVNFGDYQVSVAGQPVPLHSIARALLAFGLTTLASWLVYVLVEQPAARMKRRLQSPNAASLPSA